MSVKCNDADCTRTHATVDLAMCMSCTCNDYDMAAGIAPDKTLFLLQAESIHIFLISLYKHVMDTYQNHFL